MTANGGDVLRLSVRLHTGKFSSDNKISFVLNPLVAHGSLQDKEKLSVQGKFSCVQTGLKFHRIVKYQIWLEVVSLAVGADSE